MDFQQHSDCIDHEKNCIPSLFVVSIYTITTVCDDTENVILYFTDELCAVLYIANIVIPPVQVQY